jgi:hypothetical protein
MTMLRASIECRVKVILKTFKGKIGVPSPSLGHSSGNERLTSSFHMHVKVFEEKARAMSGIDQLIRINASSTPVFHRPALMTASIDAQASPFPSPFASPSIMYVLSKP